jgi:hypothetical protein
MPSYIRPPYTECIVVPVMLQKEEFKNWMKRNKMKKEGEKGE